MKVKPKKSNQNLLLEQAMLKQKPEPEEEWTDVGTPRALMIDDLTGPSFEEALEAYEKSKKQKQE